MSDKKIKYYLKRYRNPADYAEGDGGDHIGLFGGMEAGVVYEDDGEGETIYVDGCWNNGEARVYKYASGKESDADGWILD